MGEVAVIIMLPEHTLKKNPIWFVLKDKGDIWTMREEVTAFKSRQTTTCVIYKAFWKYFGVHWYVNLLLKMVCTCHLLKLP